MTTPVSNLKIPDQTYGVLRTLYLTTARQKPPAGHDLFRSARAHAQGDSSSSAGKDGHGGARMQSGGDRGDKVAGMRHSFALDNWLKEPRKDAPFSTVASAKASHLHHVDGTASGMPRVGQRTSSLGYLYLDYSADVENGDKAPAV
ncbi:hypothetical protein VCV18_003146 [Metarhizium anisopliae]